MNEFCPELAVALSVVEGTEDRKTVGCAPHTKIVRFINLHNTLY